MSAGSPASASGPDELSAGAMDAYSRVVIEVAAAVIPHVAALQVSGRGPDGRPIQGAGSAVLFTDDGHLLTNAHVVAEAHTAYADESIRRAALEMAEEGMATSNAALDIAEGRKPGGCQSANPMEKWWK